MTEIGGSPSIRAMEPKLVRWRRADVWDLALAVALAAAALIEARQPGRTYSHPTVMTVASMLITLPLAWRRRAPVTVALFVALAAMVEALLVTVPASAVLFIASLIAVYTVVNRCRPRMWWVVVPVGLVAAAVTEIRDPATHSVFEALPTFAVIAAVVLLAVVVRRSREQSARLQVLAADLAESRAEAEELAKAGERLRIAREMHDVLAHSVSVMVLQTGAARMALHDHEPRIRDLLAGIEEVGRDALEELRSILGVLRDVSAATIPTHRARLDKVVETMRSAGLPVHLQLAVDLDVLPDPMGVAVVRVVQEGLTNALKHGAAPATTVDISEADGQVKVVVANQGEPGPSGGSLPAGGHGLLGVAERVHTLGGTMQAGPRSGGGWQLRASLPAADPAVSTAVAS